VPEKRNDLFKVAEQTIIRVEFGKEVKPVTVPKGALIKIEIPYPDDDDEDEGAVG
jgi:hypothetical protein